MSKQRQSNFELLRIASMALIVMAHMAGHGQFAKRAAGINLYIAQFFQCGGKFWSSLLVVLGAYFCITRGVRFRSIFHIVFSAICISLGCFILRPEFFHYTTILGALRQIFTPVSSVHYWFVTSYVFLLLLSPWLNHIVHHASQREYVALLGVSTLIFSLSHTLRIPCADEVTNNLLWFVYLYLVSGYFVRFPPATVHKCGLMFTVGCLSYLAIFLLDQITLDSRYGEHGSLLIVIGSIAFFHAFLCLPLGSIRWINAISSCTFMVYLIHESYLLRQLWWFGFFRCDQWWQSPWYVPFALLIVCFFFAFAFVLNKVCVILEGFILRFSLVKRLFLLLDSLLRTDAIQQAD